MKAQQDVLVIGAGLAGLVAAWHAAASSPQSRVRLISKGWGATHWHSGCIDVLGYYPFSNNLAVEVPLERLRLLFANEPHHPYTLAGVETIAAALTAFQQLCQVAGYPLHGSLEQNWLLPTAVGALRPTCLAPQTMIAGSAHDHSPVVIVGLAGLLDFYPEMIAANLAEQGIPAQALMLELAAMTERHFNNPITLAWQMEQSKFRMNWFNGCVMHWLYRRWLRWSGLVYRRCWGLEHAAAIHTELETALGRRVFEIPGLPPSVAGIRLHTILVNAIRQAGGEVYDGMKAIGAECAEGRVVKVMTEAAGRARPHRADRFVLATGGILGGGIVTDYAGCGREAVFDPPLTLPHGSADLVQQDFMDADGHPIYRAGIHVNAEFQPINENNQPLYHNLYAIGTTLAHAEAIRERSFEGIALTTGYFVGKAINS